MKKQILALAMLMNAPIMAEWTTDPVTGAPVYVNYSGPTEQTEVRDCNPENMTITSITQTENSSNSYTGDAIVSTNCIGVYTGNPDQITPAPSGDPTGNIGRYDEGLLNGDGLTDQEVDWLLDGDDRLNLDDIADGTPEMGLLDDPGWIRLVKLEAPEESADGDSDDPTFEYAHVEGKYLEQYLTLDFDTQGSEGQNILGVDGYVFDWTLTINPGTADTFLDLLGGATFDHLTFVMKQSTEWIIYDFNFSPVLDGDITLAGLDLLEDEEFIFSGQFFSAKNYDFAEPGSLSNISVWARDPRGDLSEVPLPGAIWLFGSALLGFAGFKRFGKKS